MRSLHCTLPDLMSHVLQGSWAISQIFVLLDGITTAAGTQGCRLMIWMSWGARWR